MFLLLSLCLVTAQSMTIAQIKELRQEAEHMFYHGYDNYMKHAFPEDEIKPLSCKPLGRDRQDPTHIAVNDVLGNYSLSLVDSLTTLAVLASSPSEARRTIALHNFQSGVAALVEQYGDGTDGLTGQGLRARGFDVDSKVQVFETVIRGVGGLLSAHQFAVGHLPITGYHPRSATSRDGSTSIRWPQNFIYNGQLLRLAQGLANRLLPAFHTDTGIPYPRVNLRHGIPFYSESPLHRDAENGMCDKIPQRSGELTETCSAGAGSLLLEFTTLSRLTGDPHYETLGKRAFWSIWVRKGSTGLVGAGIDAENGLWTSSYTGIGAGIDSFYEYAAKAYILLSRAPSASPLDVHLPTPASTAQSQTKEDYESPESYLRVWREAHIAINHHLKRGKMFIHPHYIQADVFTGAPRAFWFDSLSAFYPGLLAMTGDIEEATEAHLLNTALWSRYSALPERWSVSSGSIEGGLGWWGGRPEFIESTYHLYRATQDPWYLHVGEMVLRDIKRRCWARCGWASIQDVRTGERSDRMESFFLSETVKYLILLFDPEHPLNAVDAPYVFNTEGHPLILPHSRNSELQTRNSKPLASSAADVSIPLTCPSPLAKHPFSVSAVAARGDIYHAANLARLHFMPTHDSLESHLIEYSADHPSISISDVRSPSNYTYFPWTLPLEMVPYNATCEKMAARPTFDITFPTHSNGILNSGSLQRVLNGILVNSISGLRLGMIQDVKANIEGVANSGELYRVQAINNIAMGKDEKVFLAKDTAANVINPLDPNFTRIRDTSMLDLVVDVTPGKTGSSPNNVADVFDGNATATSPPASTYSDTAQVTDHTQSSMMFAFNSLIEHVAALILKEPPETSRGVLREYLPAVTPSGAGAAPLPDVEEALGPDTSGSPQGGLLWHSVYVTGDNCQGRLPLGVPRDYQILVVKRGGCSFSHKLQNIPSVPPSKDSLQLVIVVSADDAEADLSSGWLVRPLLETHQLTSTGLPRHRPIPMVMVGGAEKTYDIFKRAIGVGLKRRYSIQAQGVPIMDPPISMSSHEKKASLAYLIGDEPPRPLPHLWSCFVDIARGNPRHTAVKSLDKSNAQQEIDSQTRTGVEWTYDKLCAKVETLAVALFQLGIRKGNAIAAFLDNRAEWALFFWVSIRLDVVFVPLNPRMIGSESEVNHVLRVTHPHVLVVLNEDDAKDLERTAPDHMANIPLRIMLSQPGHNLVNEWSRLTTLWNATESLDSDENVMQHTAVGKLHVPAPCNALDQDMSIMFTSGTTSLPKASVASYQNYLASAFAFKSLRHLDSKCVFLQHMPVFHTWSLCDTLAFWLSGATVVHPSRSFDARASLAAIESAGCTHMLAVPSMIQAMATHPSSAMANLNSLLSIDLSGTMIFRETVETCMHTLKAPYVAATYGMTEGNVVCGFDTYKIPYNWDSIPSVISCGTVTPGARLRICKPKSRTVLMMGEVGELHMGGLQVTRRYLDRHSDDFYQEDGVNWLVTGDQAKFDNQSRVHILGRYKDLIIRGGENLSPAMIEQCLNRIPGINDSQVVGIPDDIAGEIPIAVVRKATAIDLSTLKVQTLVTQELGRIYSPYSILDLQIDLVMDDFPRTISGKVQKGDLRNLVNDFISRDQSYHSDRGQSTVETLTQFWARVSGRQADGIVTDECADTFADSITMMQFCNLVSKRLHKNIAVEDLVGDVSISKQAQIVDARPVKKAVPKSTGRRGPPKRGDMVHALNDEVLVKNTHKSLQPVLERYNLDWWEDVEDVYPTDDKVALMARPFRLRTWNRRHACFAQNSDATTLRWAVEACLEVHPILRSVIIDYDKDLPLYAVFRPNEHWYNMVVSEGYEVSDPQELRTLRFDEDSIDYATVSGPLLKFMIVQIRDTKSSGLLYFGHHSVFDALSMSIWLEDLDTALRKTQKPKRHVDFKAFAQRKYLYRDNPNAITACNYHVSRLKGWTKHRSSLWPPQRAPQWFRGSDAQWTHIDGTPGKPHERRILESDPKGVSGINSSIHLPHLPTLKSKYSLTAQTTFKAALALLNVHRTSTSYAFFGQPEASRVWPTADGDPDPSLPNTMDIAGPTWETIINLIHVDTSQPLLSFLQDLQSEQKRISKYAAAPLKEIERLIAEAGEDESLENEHELFDTVFRRQCFNWLPPSRQQFTHVEEVQSLSRADVGLQWDFVHVDEMEVK
ncbi:MAG: hypothetical protein Q9170_007915, partial [Blastenia crenularia]